MSAISVVRDLDSVVSWAPLRFDLTAVEVTGAAAVLRRILYRWISRTGTVRHAPALGLTTPVTQLAGSTWSQSQLLDLAGALRREALEVDFVADCTVSVTLSGGGALRIRASVQLVDGRSYPLEVNAAGAASALLAIGGS